MAMKKPFCKKSKTSLSHLGHMMVQWGKSYSSDYYVHIHDLLTIFSETQSAKGKKQCANLEDAVPK
ncbi:hypothetical protein ACJX0J_021963, partial [Zea mays]